MSFHRGRTDQRIIPGAVCCANKFTNFSEFTPVPARADCVMHGQAVALQHDSCPGEISMRVLNYVFAAVFFVMAGLQFNDPDPVYWMAVYGGTGLIALSKALGRFSEFWAALTIGAVVAGLIYATPGVLNFIDFGTVEELTGEMTASKPYIESTREFGGLLIALVVLASYVKR
jgi:hypothetical protein